MDQLPCIIIEKKNGEKLRQWLINHSLLNHEVKIQSEGDWLFLPLVKELDENLKQELLDVFDKIRFEQHSMEIKNYYKPRDLVSALTGCIPEKLIEYIPKSFDMIGDLIVVEIPEELIDYEKLIGETILKLHQSIVSVFKKIEPVKGDYRLRNLSLVAGKSSTHTIHKENKCIYELDIEKVYFSPRLVTEHSRVCNLVKDGELILDMFAGIGPFTVLIAKHRQVTIYAIDLNPDAIFYLARNVLANKVDDRVKIFEGDAKELLQSTIDEKFDRIIMNLPSKAYQYLDIAIKSLRKNGILHYYQFVSEEEYPDEIERYLEEEIEKNGRNLEKLLNIRKVRAYAPHLWHIGVDLLIK